MRVRTRKHGLELDVIEHHPSFPTDKQPLLFLHGAYMSAWCWEAFFLPYFAAQGHPCYALSLRGHGNSEGKSHLNTSGIDDYVEDLQDLVDHLDIHPVLIGHSMGSLIIQKYLEKRPAAPAILLAPVPLGGILPSALQLAYNNPWLLAQLNFLQMAGKSLLPFDYWRDMFFSSLIDEPVMRKFCNQLQMESPRALLDAAWMGLPGRRNPHQVPMLMIGARDDTFFTPEQIQRTAEAYQADYIVIEDAGHNLMLENNWQDCAQGITNWIESFEPAWFTPSAEQPEQRSFQPARAAL